MLVAAHVSYPNMLAVALAYENGNEYDSDSQLNMLEVAHVHSPLSDRIY